MQKKNLFNHLRERGREKDGERASFATVVNGYVLAMPFRIQNPVKHLRWIFFKYT